MFTTLTTLFPVPPAFGHTTGVNFPRQILIWLHYYCVLFQNTDSLKDKARDCTENQWTYCTFQFLETFARFKLDRAMLGIMRGQNTYKGGLAVKWGRCQSTMVCSINVFFQSRGGSPMLWGCCGNTCHRGLAWHGTANVDWPRPVE